MNIKKDGKKKITIEFDSIDDVVEHLRSDLRPKGYSVEYDNQSFCKYSWDEAMNFLENGWIEGISKMDAVMHDIEGQGEGFETYIKYDVTGDFLNVGRFMAGEPECCGQFKKRKTKTGDINLMVNISAHAHVNQETMINRGAAIQSLVDNLMDTHFVNLQFVEHTRDICEFKEFTIIINCDTRNFYSREAIAFMTGNPAFLRRICFAIDEIHCKKDKCGGYGIPDDIPTDERKDIDLYFGALRGDEERKWQTPQICKENVNKLIAEVTGREPEDNNGGYIPPSPGRVQPLAGRYGNR